MKTEQVPMPMTVVSVVRDHALYDRLVRRNPRLAGARLAPLDNTVENRTIPVRYNAFLEGLDAASDEWLVFCHEDFEFLDDPRPLLARTDRRAIYGVFGCARRVPGLGLQIDSNRDGSEMSFRGTPVTGPTPSDTVDCACLIVHAALIRQYGLRFDERLTYDLYTEDFSIAAAERHGIATYVLPIRSHHYSYGHILPRFHEQLAYLNEKYASASRVYATTTCYAIGRRADVAAVQAFLSTKGRIPHRWLFYRKVSHAGRLTVKILGLPVWRQQVCTFDGWHTYRGIASRADVHTASAADDVTIILPMYNGEKFLRRTLDSVRAQTYPHWRCLCIDDGGTDGSAAIARTFAAADPRFGLVVKENGGVASARNAGLARATGAYVTFLDQDDLLPPQALAALVGVMTASGADVVQGKALWFHGTVPSVETPAESDYLLRGKTQRRLLELKEWDVDLDVWGKLYRRSALAGCRLPDGVYGADDYVFTMRVCAAAASVALTDAPVYLYDMNPDNVTSRMPLAYLLGVIDAEECVWNELVNVPDVSAADKRRYVRRATRGLVSWCIKKALRTPRPAAEIDAVRKRLAEAYAAGFFRPSGVSDRLKYNLFAAGRRTLMRLLFPRICAGLRTSHSDQ